MTTDFTRPTTIKRCRYYRTTQKIAPTDSYIYDACDYKFSEPSYSRVWRNNRSSFYVIHDVPRRQTTTRNFNGYGSKCALWYPFYLSTVNNITDISSQSIIKYTRSLQDMKLICGHLLWSIQRYIATILTALLLPPLHQRAGPATSVWLLYYYLLRIRRRNLQFMTTTTSATTILATSTCTTFIIQCAYFATLPLGLLRHFWLCNEIMMVCNHVISNDDNWWNYWCLIQLCVNWCYANCGVQISFMGILYVSCILPFGDVWMLWRILQQLEESEG